MQGSILRDSVVAMRLLDALRGEETADREEREEDEDPRGTECGLVPVQAVERCIEAHTFGHQKRERLYHR